MLWVIGSGLKLKAEPSKVMLNSAGIEADTELFNDAVEARFDVYTKSTLGDHGRSKSIHRLARLALKNAIIGGDVLVILRYTGKFVTVQLVDGSQVRQPIITTAYITEAVARGNKVRNGVEISPDGEIVAFFVADPDNFIKFERIPAKNAALPDITQAFLVSGLEFRLDSVRGLPLTAAVLETLKKLDRYKEATVGSAEERQKIVMAIEHDAISTGDSPLQQQIARAVASDSEEDLPEDADGQAVADRIAVTTNKQVFNLTRGSKLTTVESKNELYFKDFFSVNIDLVCAALGIPPNVATSKYDANFSASRAALKDWEHTMRVSREDFAELFYKRIYDFWVEMEILTGRISAPGYLQARNAGDELLTAAYRSARFIGPSVPHIDPLKEVKAEREKLGSLGASIPLTTVEDATETLSSGDSDSNMEQFSKELETAKELKIFREPQAPRGTPSKDPQDDPPPAGD